MLILIFSTSNYLPWVVNWLRARNLLRLSLNAALAVAAIPVILLFVRLRLSPKRLILTALISCPVLAYVLWPTDSFVEKIHLIEYGSLAFFVHQWLTTRPLSRRAVPATAWIAVSLIGLGDELWQGWLPNRFFDTRDIIVNSLGAAYAIFLTHQSHD